MDLKRKLQLYRELFYSRQDVFGRRWESLTDDGGKRSGYAPVCQNFWTAGCHIKNKTGTRCDGCEIKKYTPVSEESVLRHIKGDEVQIQYVLQTDGTIKFGAVDFDYKPGKEDKGYTFADVKRFMNVLEAWGIPHVTARSTTEGFHTYIFLEEFYAANKFRAIIFEAFERCGFMENLRLGTKPIPEIFPKQSYNSPDGIGNGIKTPMIEHMFMKERNGLVDRDNVFIGAGLPAKERAEAQWAFLASIPKTNSAQLDAIIAGEEIEVYEEGPGSSSTAANRRMSGAQRKGKWQPPLAGSIEKVLEGCAAFRKVKDACATGTPPGHQEGFALFHLAMRTNDGLDWFHKSVPGWGQDDTQMKQLEHSVKKDYLPWTCRKMQDNGVCVRGTQCFKKKPPSEMVEGQLVERRDLPEDQWLEPSPIRYAYGRGEDFLKKILEEAEALKAVVDKEERFGKLKELAYRSQVFDENQQKELKAFIKDQKLAKANEIGKIFNAASEQSNKDLEESVVRGENSVKIDENLYEKAEPYGYYAVKAIRAKSKKAKICEFDLWVEEVRTYFEDDKVFDCAYKGRFQTYGFDKPFEIPASRWSDNSEFIKYFSTLAGPEFNVQRANVDLIRQAAVGFSKRRGISRAGYLLTQGYYGNASHYLMPSVVVERDGVKPNTEQHVDLNSKEYAKYLDFALLQEDELRDVLLHLKTDFLNAWPREWTTVSLAHALQPVIMRPLEFTKKPSLFFEGLTGAGKTELTHTLQHLWGDFPSVMNLQSSGKGIMDVGHDFKDALLVLDDFKGLSNYQIENVRSAIQYSYDGGVTIKMQRNQTQHKGKGSRALFMFSGEQFISADASVVARCILIGVTKQDTTGTKDLYDRCVQMRRKYSGVTAKFIQWFLNSDMEAFKKSYNTFYGTLYSEISGRTNAERICYNLSLNHLTWRMFVMFLLHHDVASHAEAEELVNEHWSHIKELMWKMADRCQEEQNSWVFIRVLKQLLESGEVSIKNLKGFHDEKKPHIGFVNALMPPGKAGIYPEITVQRAKTFMRDTPIFGTVRSIGQQLIDAGVISDTDNERGQNRSQKVVRDAGERHRVWVVDLKRLGVLKDDTVKGAPEPLPFEPSDYTEQKLEGII